MRITPRLVLLAALPLVVAVAFAARALAPATSQALEANRLTSMAELASTAGDLTHALQRERMAAASVVASQGGSITRFQSRVEATDRSTHSYRDQRAELSDGPEGTAVALRRVDRSLDGLSSLRAQVRSGSGSLSSLAFGYRIAVADLIAYRDSIAQADGIDSAVADRIRAAAALSKAAEQLGQQQVTVARAFAGGGLTPASRQSFDATRLAYAEATADVYALGPPEWRSWLERSLSGPKALRAQRLEDGIGRAGLGHQLSGSPREWYAASSARLDLLRSVERRTDSAVLDTVTEKRTSLLWWAAGELLVVVLTLVVAVFVTLRLGRAMIGRLRHLRNAAHDVAQRRLPEIMKELSQPRALGRATPEEIAARSGSPLETVGRDEIGEVGQAFNAVHYEAVRLAAQQTVVHEQFAESLVGVARRGAELTGVMAAQLDAVQRDELDPERMKTLFALDHLAIRMDRNTNNLLVLGGHGHGRVRRSDASCTSVIYAAAQQIERYGRVSLGHIEPTIGIAARAVDDIAHLLAELLDNATRFSPPDTEVGVAAWHLWDRTVVQIVDEGVGVAPARRAELNARLAEPQADVGAAVRTMGLHVVARLAARHGVTVELRASSGAGTIAEVSLPQSALARPPAPDEAQPDPSQGVRGTERGGVEFAELLESRAFVQSPTPAGSGDFAQSARSGASTGTSTGASAEAVRSGMSAESARSGMFVQPGHPGQPGQPGQPAEESDHRRAPDTTAARDTRPGEDETADRGGPRAGAAARTGAQGQDRGQAPQRPAVPAPHDRQPTGTPDTRTPAAAARAPARGAADAASAQSVQPAQSPQPADRVAGVSSSGLPMRRPLPPQERPAPVRRPGASGGPGGSGGPGAARAEAGAAGPPRRRDSRQVSDVLAAYAQGISRSTRNRSARGGTSPSPVRPSDDEDDTQRSTS
ncbi:sensor histidine kinase [Streptomyces iconiensis]|uniref:histidine kinase n=1 Tax=Streptomyces iconiensis TaxID=1384038 RepID=A0ABT6ZXQ3_9ACTN|nr:nitrate- and nitrite sensing domain-containing protein [Streptomyces iconiensis]MDJ1133632.1 nitrate- and nitrite sensing domain-containing protein [Streptomyces iconiensis]